MPLCIKRVVNVLDCKSLQLVLKSGGKCISHQKTDEMIDAIYSSVILGIYSEMTGGLKIGEDIVFGGQMDLGSRVKKCNEYEGVGVKYPVIRDASLITRVIAFKKCVFKDGRNLMLTLTDTIDTFNDEIKKLRAQRRHLFLVVLLVLPDLSLQNIESSGVDGVLISKMKMINKRIQEVNPRCIVHHCGNHRTALL